MLSLESCNGLAMMGWGEEVQVVRGQACGQGKGWGHHEDEMGLYFCSEIDEETQLVNQYHGHGDGLQFHFHIYEQLSRLVWEL